MSALLFLYTMLAKELSINYNARYYQLGELTSSTNQLWFVIHGYGQLARYFIQKFNILDNGDHCVIAPEGLSKFYLEGYSGRVGATWMTKEDRLTDIENYVNYLNTLYHSLKNSQTNLRVNVVGFSQGAATASRWVAQSSVSIDRLILWAGIFPPDMDVVDAGRRFSNMEVINVYGEKDPFLDNNKFKEQFKIIKSLGITSPTITFDGVHDIDSDTLLALA